VAIHPWAQQQTKYHTSTLSDNDTAVNCSGLAILNVCRSAEHNMQLHFEAKAPLCTALV
jgi:hypothetical protein